MGLYAVTAGSGAAVNVAFVALAAVEVSAQGPWRTLPNMPDVLVEVAIVNFACRRVVVDAIAVVCFACLSFSCLLVVVSLCQFLVV